MKTKKKVTKKKNKSVTKKLKASAKKVMLKKKKGKITSSTKNAAASNQTIAPHFDTAQRSNEPNPDVEVAKNSLTDIYETDSRPKGS